MNARLSSLLVAGGLVLGAMPSGLLSAASNDSVLNDSKVSAPSLQSVSLDSDGSMVTLAIPGFQGQPKLQFLAAPRRVVVDLPGVEPGSLVTRKQVASLCQGDIRKARMAKFGDGTRLVLEVADGIQADVSALVDGVGILLTGQEGAERTLPAVTPLIAKDIVPSQPVVAATTKMDMETSELAPVPSIGLPFQTVSSFAVASLLPANPGQTPQEPAVEAVPDTLHRNSRTLGQAEQRYTGSRMTFDVRSMEIQEFLRIVADHAKLNLVADPDVQGVYGFKFVDTPWDQVLDIMLKHAGLGVEIQNGVIRVAKVEKLQKEEEDRKRLEDAKALAGQLQTVSRPLSFAKVGEARAVIEKVITKRGSLITDDRTNTLIISDLPRNIPLIDDILAQLDVQIQQVQIEARVVEANKDFERDFGVIWPNTNAGQAKLTVGGTDAPWMNYGTSGTWNSLSVSEQNAKNALGTGWSTDTGIAGPAGQLWVSFLSNRFSVNTILQALESEGKLKIVSAPKIVTQNNKKAKILAGEKIPYPTQQGGAAGGAITVAFIDANLELDVTPQITSDGTILMDIKVEKSEADFGKQVNGTPRIIRKAVETQVLVKDGGTVVLGGVYTTKTNSGTKSVPWLGKIPVLGWLFRNKIDQEASAELLVFISPRILKM